MGSKYLIEFKGRNYLIKTEKENLEEQTIEELVKKNALEITPNVSALTWELFDDEFQSFYVIEKADFPNGGRLRLVFDDKDLPSSEESVPGSSQQTFSAEAM